MQDCNLLEHEVDWGRPKSYTKETISKLIIVRSVYKDPTKFPEEIYNRLDY